MSHATRILELAEELRADTALNERDVDGYAATASLWTRMGWANVDDIERALLALATEDVD